MCATMSRMPIVGQPWRFFDPTLGVPDPTSPPAEPTALYQLDRKLDAGRECFGMLAPFAYLDRVSGYGVVAPHDLPLGLDIVDQALTDGTGSTFESDLTSVPAVFTWLVPKTGAHLPAALVHDSMIGDDEYVLVRQAGGEAADGFLPASVFWKPGSDTPSPFTAVDADRIFRDAMADSGTGLIRRWLVWTAVTLRTMFARDGTSDAAWVRWWYAIVAGCTLLAIAWLGYQATAHIFDWTGSWPCTDELPWIVSELPGPLDDLRWAGEGFGARFVSGAFWAILLPIPVGVVLWGRFRAAGVIAGIAFAVLFHVTIALLVLSAVYLVAETVVTPGRSLAQLLPRKKVVWPGLAVAGALVALIVAICWLR